MDRDSTAASISPDPSPDDIRVFQMTSRGGPTRKNFIVVLDSNIKCPWNCQAAELFSSKYVRRSDAQSREKDVVRQAFFVHLRALQRKCKIQHLSNAPAENLMYAAERQKVDSDSQRNLHNVNRKTVCPFPRLSLDEILTWLLPSLASVENSLPCVTEAQKGSLILCAVLVQMA